MRNTTLFPPAATVRKLLALAACGGAILSTLPAHAQYDQVEGPGGPLVSVPQIVVQRSEVPASERAQLAARRIQPDRAAAAPRPPALEAQRQRRPQDIQRGNNNGG